MEVMVTLAFGQKDQVMGVPLIAARFGQGPEIVGQGMLGRSLAAVFQGRVVAEMVETVPVFSSRYGCPGAWPYRRRISRCP